jgi:hypothetical protein
MVNTNATAREAHTSSTTCRVLRGARGCVEFSRLRDDVVLMVLRGHLDGEAASEIVATLPSFLDRPGVRFFWDGAELTSHGPRVPSQIVPMLARLRGNIDEFHVLLHAPTLDVSMAAASLALGGELVMYRDRGQFQDALVDAVNETSMVGVVQARAWAETVRI